MKEFEENTNKGKAIPHPLIGRIKIVEISILIKTVHRFNAFSIKIPMEIFTEIEKIPKYL